MNRLAQGCCTLRGAHLRISFAVFLQASGPVGAREALPSLQHAPGEPYGSFRASRSCSTSTRRRILPDADFGI